MYDLKDKVIIITGASMGIGASLARAAASQGARVALAARSIDKTQQIAREVLQQGGQSIAVECDVTRPEFIQRTLQETLQKWNRIDILVNNAGFGMGGTFESAPLESIRKIFETNVFGAIAFAQAVIPIFRKQGEGMIVNVESIVGLRSMPLNSFYSATKHALHAISEALRAELFRDRIHVLSVCPGLIRTEFTRNKLTFGPDLDVSPPWLYMSADRCAQKIIQAIQKKKRQVVITGHGKLITCLQRISPGFLDFIFARDYQTWIHPQKRSC